MQRILVVDDDGKNRYLLEVLLKKLGYDVQSAGNGKEALEAARIHPPDLAISDILMPAMDGFTLCRRWKSDEKMKKIPFIFYTATYTGADDEEFALSLGADRFLVKPMEVDALALIIRDAISKPAKAPPGTGGADEAASLRTYGETVSRKLEKKVSDLERANRELERIMEERRRAEEALRESETKYRIVADNTYHWEFWQDDKGAFRYVSPSCKRITGREPGELSREPGLLLRIMHPEDRQKYERHLEEKEARRESGSLEFRIIHADGTVRWIAHDCQPLFDPEGRFLGTRGSNRDITENKDLEEQLRHAQRVEMVGRLAGGVAHDLNNILTVIIGFSAIVKERLGRDDPAMSTIDQIYKAAERAAVLTGGMLAFSRRRPVDRRPVDLNGLLRGMEPFMRTMIGADVELSISTAPEDVTVSADAGQLEQVVMNLAANARDAIRGSGAITISTTAIDMDDEFIRVHGYGTRGRCAVISVSDTGIGMGDEIKQKMFEPFFTTKEAGKGTGLGLPIVYGIVKDHRGFINVYTEPGKGTTFRILLPAVGETVHAETAREGMRNLRGHETIMVADDDPAKRRLLDTFLTGLGYTVITAADGRTAMDLFTGRKGPIHLAVMDVFMPEKNGIDAYREMKAADSGVKAIMISGFPEEVIRGQGFLDPGVSFMVKPLRPLEFAAEVRRVLGEPGGG